MRNWLNIGLLLTLTATLISCSSSALNNPGATPLDQTLPQLQQNIQRQTQPKTVTPPPAVLQSLVAAPEPLARQVVKQEERFDVSANAVPAQEFFMSLVKGTPYNIVVSPQIQGTITLHLNQVTIQQVLAAIKDNYGYQYRKEPYGYQIYPERLQTRIFEVHYLDMVRSGKSYVSVESGLISQQKNESTSASGQTSTSVQNVSTPSSSVMSDSKVDFWENLKQSLETIVGETKGAKVVMNPASGLIVITATPPELDKIAEYLDDLNDTITKQVLIQAEVVDVVLSKGFQAGIDWSLLGAKQEGNTNLGDGLDSFTSIFSLTGSIGGTLKGTLNLLSTQGNVQVLSSPRVSTLNNQKAVIKIGRDEYFVTDVSNTVSGSGTEAQSTQDIQMEPFFSGVSLAVTPSIVGKDGVMLSIHPIVSTVSDGNKTVTIGDKKTTIPAAKSEIDETDSVVFAHSGQVIALSGLIQNSTVENLGSTPFLGDIPFAGSLFRRTNQSSIRSELVILLRPVVMDNHTWVQNLKKTHQNLQGLNKGYHFGPFPSRFGNKAEMEGVNSSSSSES